MKVHRKRIAQLDEQMQRDNTRMAAILELLADPDFYTQEDSNSDIISEYATLKARLDKAEEEWLRLNEEVEAELARQQEQS